MGEEKGLTAKPDFAETALGEGLSNDEPDAYVLAE